MRNALIDEVSEHCQFIYKQLPSLPIVIGIREGVGMSQNGHTLIPKEIPLPTAW